MKRVVLSFVFAVLMASLVCAQNATLDISIDGKAYSTGENISYEVRLFDGAKQISAPVDVAIYDYARQKVIDLTVDSNKPQSLLVGDDFPDGFWNVEAFYQGKSVKRIFSVGSREEADFSISEDKLIITNTGNTAYTKTIQILIGEKIVSQKQYIEVGQSKTIKLVAPNGDYDIEVGDGTNSVSFSNVHLIGTGNVIGALDEELINNPSLLGGIRDSSAEDVGQKSGNISLAIIFMIGIFALFLLSMIEQFLRKRNKRRGLA